MYNRALRLIREFHRLSQSEVASKVGLSNSYVSELEKGTKKASIEVLEKYAEAFKLPMSSLILFAERVENDNRLSEKSRVFVADKVLKMLEWIHASANDAA